MDSDGRAAEGGWAKGWVSDVFTLWGRGGDRVIVACGAIAGLGGSLLRATCRVGRVRRLLIYRMASCDATISWSEIFAVRWVAFCP